MLDLDAIRKRAEEAKTLVRVSYLNWESIGLERLAIDVLALLDAREAWRTKDEDELKIVVQLRAENALLRAAAAAAAAVQQAYPGDVVDADW